MKTTRHKFTHATLVLAPNNGQIYSLARGSNIDWKLNIQYLAI